MSTNEIETMTTPRSFMKFLGGKAKLVPTIMDHMPSKIGIYHEPFVGGGALYWHLLNNGWLRRAYLADADPRLVRTWRAVRSYPHIVLRKLEAMPNDAEFFKRIRGKAPDDEHSSDVAAWRIYLAKTAFNGLYRTNRAGIYNVPFGKYANPKIADTGLILACSEAMRSVPTTIRHADFSVSIARARKGDLVYCDPPYLPLSKTSNFVGYTGQGFGDASHVKLRDALVAAKARGVHVIASNADVPRARELYGDHFNLFTVKTRRNVAANGTKRAMVDELIITSGCRS